jgi:phthalate 4,5-dioxygenase reductase component
MEGTLRLRVRRKLALADDIYGFELAAADGAALPAYSPGAHITLTTPSGQKRRYSLCDDATLRDRYFIAVKRETGGRGGSLSFTTQVAEGDIVEAEAPGNDFPMATAAPKRHVFVAGGIGITPIRSMILDLERRGLTNWTLHYLTRAPELTAFRDEFLAADFAGRVVLHHDGGDPPNALDLWPILEKPDDAHLYCCGPRGLMDAVRDMTGHWPDGAVRFEDFGASQTDAAVDTAFEVHLARAGRTVSVPPGVSILDALRKAGISLPSSCESGSCGTCRVGLIEGKADHRDFVLLDDEHDAAIMICVSRAKSPSLTLDI